MRKNLFEIQSEYMEYLDELSRYCEENETDEIPEEILERLNINKNEVEEKLGNYNLYIAQLAGEAETLKLKEKQYAAKRKARENTIEKLKDLMAQAVKLYGEVNLTSKSKATNLPKTISTVEGKYTFIYQNKLVADVNIVPEDYVLYDLVVPELTAKEYKAVTELLQSKNILGELNKPATPKLNKDKLEIDLEEGKEIKGANIDTNNGYIKIT